MLGVMRRGPGFVGALVGFFLLPASSQAATIKVTTSQDEFGTGPKCSLREAIEAANTDSAFGGCPAGSGADVIFVRGGVKYIREQTAIDDTNAGGDMTLRARSRSRFEAPAWRRSTLAESTARSRFSLPALSRASRLVITNGYPIIGSQEGGGIFDQGELSLSESKVVKNSAPGNTCSCGGGIAVSMAKATLDRVRVIGNSADNIGGGVGFFGGTLNVAAARSPATTPATPAAGSTSTAKARPTR